MIRLIFITTLGLMFLSAQAPPKPQKPPVQEELPPEEDAAAKPKEYTFNPLQAENELKTGEFYFRKGKFKAAADRFKEATLWNPTLAEAFLRLGEADEKRHDRDGAKQAYSKYLEIAPDSKRAGEVKKKLDKL